jgi:hypothetical protein
MNNQPTIKIKYLTDGKWLPLKLEEFANHTFGEVLDMMDGAEAVAEMTALGVTKYAAGNEKWQTYYREKRGKDVITFGEMKHYIESTFPDFLGYLWPRDFAALVAEVFKGCQVEEIGPVVTESERIVSKNENNQPELKKKPTKKKSGLTLEKDTP